MLKQSFPHQQPARESHILFKQSNKQTNPNKKARKAQLSSCRSLKQRVTNIPRWRISSLLTNYWLTCRPARWTSADSRSTCWDPSVWKNTNQINHVEKVRTCCNSCAARLVTNVLMWKNLEKALIHQCFYTAFTLLTSTPAGIQQFKKTGNRTGWEPNIYTECQTTARLHHIITCRVFDQLIL